MRKWTRGEIIAECLCGIVAVIIGVWVGVNVGNGDWFNKPERAARYSHTTTIATSAEGERFATAAAIINSRVKELRDAIGQQRDINDYRLWREMRIAEEKALSWKTSRHKDLK